MRYFSINLHYKPFEDYIFMNRNASANLTVYIQTILFDIFQVDSAADYLFQSSAVRGSIQYPAPFGRDATPEEAKIAELDAKTGASLKV